MISVALRGLAGRKLRAALTAIAIVLGVAMVSGTYVLTDTIDKAFDSIFSESYAGTDAVVSGHESDISFQGDTAQTPPVPARLLNEIRALPSVDVAMGGVYDDSNTKIIRSNGKAIDTQGAPTFGFGLDTSPQLARFNPLNLLEGRWPRGPNEVVLDVGSADDQGYKVGDSVRVSTLEPAREFKVVGVARYGNVDSLGSATFVVFDLPTAQKLLKREGEFDAISVAAKNGVSPEQLVRDIKQVVPADVTVRTGVAEAKEQQDEIGEFTKFIRYFLLAFAGISLFVGAFVIFNTLSITVAQRTREFATLRTIGASRRQVLGSVVLESLVIGALASVVGLFAGLGLAKGLNSLFVALNLDLPTAGTVFALRTIIVSLVVGVLVTLIAGIYPAIRATRVPPLAAVREGAVLPRGRFARFTPWIAGLTIVLAVLLLAYGVFVDDLGTAERLLSLAVGVLLLFIGVALLSSRLVRPLATLLTPLSYWLMFVLGIIFYPFMLLAFGLRAVLAAIGIGSRMELPALRPDPSTRRLAGENAGRNPGRTAATAAALMIGIALVTFVAVLANGMKASNRGAIEDQVRAEYVVTSQDGFTPFVAAAGDEIAKSPVAEFTTSVRSDLGEVAGSGKYVTGIDPQKIATAYNFDWENGSNAILGELGRNGAIIDKDFAEQKNLSIGDRFTLLTPSNERVQLVVKGIYKPPPFYPLLGSVSVTTARFDSLYERPRNQFTFVDVAGEPDASTTRALERTVANFPDAKVQTRAEWITQQDEDFNQFLYMLYVLLALSVIVSIFGMVNTLVLSVFERTRELGMLRAVGMTRRQARRMVRHESVVTALIGAALGLPLGIFLAALVTVALAQFEVQFSIPVGQLVVFAVVAMIVGILAALLPARRAARLNVLHALQYE
jgi:putative ABC transport system permease protein